MRISHRALFATALLFTCTPLASATSVLFSASFDSPTYNTGSTQNIHLQDGWVINDTPTSAPAMPDQLSFFSDIDGTGDMWGALGGPVSGPNLQNVELSHTGSAALSDVGFSGTFKIVESNVSFPGRDAFGVSFKNGSSDVFRLAFEPSPTFPTQMAMAYYDSANVRTSLTQAAVYGGKYSLNLAFTPNGANADFVFTVTPEVGPGSTRTGSVVGGSMTKLALDFDVDPLKAPSAAGSNYIAWNNIVVTVPEPATALFGMIGLATALVRRRRN